MEFEVGKRYIHKSLIEMLVLEKIGNIFLVKHNDGTISCTDPSKIKYEDWRKYNG